MDMCQHHYQNLKGKSQVIEKMTEHQCIGWCCRKPGLRWNMLYLFLGALAVEVLTKFHYSPTYLLLLHHDLQYRINVLEYSLVVVSVLSIGHLSTTALAAITIGEMSVNVTGLSIIQGFASALDTLLPSAWTSPHPQLVGLWTQRMSTSRDVVLQDVNVFYTFPLVVVVSFFLIVSTGLFPQWIIYWLATSSQPIFILWINAEAVLLKLKQEPEVAHLAAVYLRWMCLGLPGTFTLSKSALFHRWRIGLFSAYAFNCISRWAPVPLSRPLRNPYCG